MAGKSSTVTVQILADNSQYKREMGETAQVTDKTTQKMGGATEGVGKKMSTFAKVAVAAVAVQALGAVKDFVGDSIRAFSDLNESMNAVEVTFGRNADGIKKLGEQAARNLGLSNAEFNGFAVQMSAFAHAIAGDGGDVVGVVDELSTRVSDFASVMNLEVADAARLFQSGLAGETEPLRKYGIDLSAQAVKAHALAEGIGAGTGELTEQEKVLARYSLVMAQTDKVAGDFANTATDLANAQRIAAAEMENAKARAGEALVPFAQLTTELKLLGAETLGLVATGFQVLFGDMTKAQGALQSFEILTGATADTLDAMVTVNKDTGISFEDLAEAMALTAEESEPLTESQKDFLEQVGYTQDDIKELDRLLVGEHAAAMDRAESGTGEYADAVEELEDATEELNVDIRTGIELAREAYDANRAATDALFGVESATRNQAEAQKAVNDAVKEFGDGSPEHIQALEDLAGANGDVKDAQIKLVEQGALTREEFINQQTSLGLTREQAELLADAYDELFKPRSVTHTINFKQPTATNPGRVPGRQHGGPVRKDQPVLVGEDGKPELFVPESNGTIIPNNKLRGNGGTPVAGGMVAYFTINAGLGTDPRALERAVVEALQSWQRSNGAIPITVRSA